MFNKKFLFTFFIFIFALLFYKNISFGARVVSNYPDPEDETRTLITYEYCGEVGSFYIPNSYLSKSMALFIDQYNTPIMFVVNTFKTPSTRTLELESLNGTSRVYNSSYANYLLYYYDSSTESWSAYSNSYNYTFPSNSNPFYVYGFLAYFNLDTCTFDDVDFYHLQYISSGLILENLSDENYTVNLTDCYEGYSETQNDEDFVYCSGTSITSCLLKVSDTTVNGDYYYTLNWSKIQNYITDEHKLVINLDNFVTEFNTQFTFEEGHEYEFIFELTLSRNISGPVSYTQTEKYGFINTHVYGSGTSIGPGGTDEDNTNQLLTNSINEQTNILKEQNETSKGIWGTLTEVLSYINPFSENFFAYKLVELILDGLKTLFIPQDGFFNTFFTDLKNWFSDRFGFLFYPFELIIDLLNRILNIDLGEPKFNIPDIVEPSTNKVLFYATEFNFNDILENSAFNTMHNIYFIMVDAIIIFALINLIKSKLEEVETK